MGLPLASVILIVNSLTGANAMYIHHQDISTTHKANVTRTLQSALQTLFALTPGERAKNFSENVTDPANGASQAAQQHGASKLHRLNCRRMIFGYVACTDVTHNAGQSGKSDTSVRLKGSRRVKISVAGFRRLLALTRLHLLPLPSLRRNLLPPGYLSSDQRYLRAECGSAPLKVFPD